MKYNSFLKPSLISHFSAYSLTNVIVLQNDQEIFYHEKVALNQDLLIW